MLNYTTLEIELVNRLNSCFTERGISEYIKAVTEPDTNTKFDALMQNLSTQTKIIVKYLSSDYSDTESNTTALVEEKIIVGCMVISQALHTEQGLYSTLNLLKLFLVGYKPEDAHKSLLPVKIEVVEHAQLGLVNMHTFKTATWVQQSFDLNEIPIALFKKLTSQFLPLTTPQYEQKVPIQP